MASPIPQTPGPTGIASSSTHAEPLRAFSPENPDRTEQTAAVAGGIESLIGPAMRDCRSRVAAADSSQKRLVVELDRLTEALDLILEDVPMLSLSSKSRVEQMPDLHNRLSALATNLNLIQDRMHGMSKILSERETKEGQEVCTPVGQTTASPGSNWSLLRTPYAGHRGNLAVSERLAEKVTKISTPEAMAALLSHRGQ